MITKEENELFIELEKNIADEAEARESYYKLLSKFDYLFTEKELSELREIISEELKHTKLLNAMIQRRNGIIAER